MGTKQSLQAPTPFFRLNSLADILSMLLHLGACLQTTLIPSIPYYTLLALLDIGIDLTY